MEEHVFSRGLNGEDGCIKRGEDVQKQLYTYVLQNGCYKKFRNIQRKTSVLESIFNKVAGVKTWFYHEWFYNDITMNASWRKIIFVLRKLDSVKDVSRNFPEYVLLRVWWTVSGGVVLTFSYPLNACLALVETIRTS